MKPNKLDPENELLQKQKHPEDSFSSNKSHLNNKGHEQPHITHKSHQKRNLPHVQRIHPIVNENKKGPKI